MSTKYQSNSDMTSKEELVTEDPKMQRKSKFFVYILTVLSTLGGFLFGYDTGVVSGAMLLIRKDFPMTHIWHEVIVSATVAAALVFSLVGGWLADRFGRKPAILVSGVVFTIGSIIMGAAQNKEVLLVGRVVVGVAIGIESMSVPVYIAECANPNQRGMLVTIYQLFITLGMLMASVIGGIFSDVTNGWRYMLGLAGVPSLFQLLGFLFMPESPRWLTSQRKFAEASKVLLTVRGSVTDADQEMAVMKATFEEREREIQEHAVISGGRPLFIQVFSSRAIRRALFVGCFLQGIQQLSGINTVMYYSATIIRMSGVQQESLAIWLSALVAAVNSVSTFIGVYLVDRSGRRRLVLFSLLGIISSLLLLGIGFELMSSESPLVTKVGESSKCGVTRSCEDCMNEAMGCGFCFVKTSNGSIMDGSCWRLDGDKGKPLDGPCLDKSELMSEFPSTMVWANGWCPSTYSWLPILAMALYLVSFAPGMGPMPWTINAEIYPLWARGFCTSLSTMTSWAANLIISSTFLSLLEALSKPGAFYLYAAIAAFGLIIIWCTLPETKGRSLEDMEGVFLGEWFRLRGRGHHNDVLGTNNVQKKSIDNKNGIDLKIEAVSTHI